MVTNNESKKISDAKAIIESSGGSGPQALKEILSSLDKGIDPADYLENLRTIVPDLNLGDILNALLNHDARNSSENVYLTVDGRIHRFPVVKGSENDQAVDIRNLLARTGHVTLDSGFMNTAACESAVTYTDGEKGILRYRGYDISDLANKSTFIETSMLLIFGELPTFKERSDFRSLLTDNEMLHEGLRHHFDAFPSHGEPMAFLSAILNTMSAYEPEFLENERDDGFTLSVAKIMSKIRTIAANTYNKSVGHPLVFPDPSLRYCENFLQMMFTVPNKIHEPSIIEIDALEKILILHADHEQNCSTSTVRIVGSSKTNLFGSISAGVNALRGKSHGGANSAVITMLEEIYQTGGSIHKIIEKAKKGNYRLMGFGHRVYKNFDPRAKILKKTAEQVLKKLKQKDPLMDIAKQLEDAALQDEYFIEKKLYPNVDFYSGIILRALKIPLNMFPVIFAIGRTPGWIAHWREQHLDSATKIARPRQIYTGEKMRRYVPIE